MVDLTRRTFLIGTAATLAGASMSSALVDAPDREITLLSTVFAALSPKVQWVKSAQPHLVVLAPWAVVPSSAVGSARNADFRPASNGFARTAAALTKTVVGFY